MTNLKLKRPIKIDTQGQVVVDLAAMGDGEIVSHSLSNFINEYRFKG